MTLKQLEYVIMAAQTGNMTKAADKLFLSQPSLTHAINELETELNIQIFNRRNKGITLTKEGEEFLGYARQILEQTSLLEAKYKGSSLHAPRFCVSCQHYSFAVNAFVDVIRQFDSNRYDFILRETQTNEIIEDVSTLKSEIGILYLSHRNRDVLTAAFRKNDLIFEELFTARPHVFISNTHPLRVVFEYPENSDITAKVLREIEYNDRDRVTRIKKYEYNEDGSKKCQKNYYPNGKLESVKTYEYVPK